MLRCQHCNGSLYLDRDEHTGEATLKCYQCSREHDLDGNLIVRPVGFDGQMPYHPKPGTKKQRSGHMGGITTFMRYGSEHMSRISRSRKNYRGRLRLKTIEELLTAEVKTKEERIPNNLRELKRLYGERQKGEAHSDLPVGVASPKGGG